MMKTQKIGLNNEKHDLFYVKKMRSIFTKVLGFNKSSVITHIHEVLRKFREFMFFANANVKLPRKILLRVWKFTTIYEQ